MSQTPYGSWETIPQMRKDISDIEKMYEPISRMLELMVSEKKFILNLGILNEQLRDVLKEISEDNKRSFRIELPGKRRKRYGSYSKKVEPIILKIYGAMNFLNEGRVWDELISQLNMEWFSDFASEDDLTLIRNLGSNWVKMDDHLRHFSQALKGGKFDEAEAAFGEILVLSKEWEKNLPYSKRILEEADVELKGYVKAISARLKKKIETP